jgi:hypothetical protein
MSQFAGPFAVIGAGLNLASAISSNRALGQTMNNLASATQQEQNAVEDAAAVERLAAVQRGVMLRGSIIASASSRGVGQGGIADLLRAQVASETISNMNRNTNRSNRQREITSQFRATMSQLRGQFQNPLLAAVTGGLQGAQMGLALGSGLNALDEAANMSVAANLQGPPVALAGGSYPTG